MTTVVGEDRFLARVSYRGLITIPKAIRDKHNIQRRDFVELKIEKVVLVADLLSGD